MSVVRDFKQVTLSGFIAQHVAPGSTVYTDGFAGFTGVHAADFKHVARPQPIATDLRKGVPSVVPLTRHASSFAN
jgi:transposase-like protein